MAERDPYPYERRPDTHYPGVSWSEWNPGFGWLHNQWSDRIDENLYNDAVIATWTPALQAIAMRRRREAEADQQQSFLQQFQAQVAEQQRAQQEALDATRRAIEAQAAEARRRAEAEQARREEAERVRGERFDEIDKLFANRAPFYQQVHDTLQSQGRRRASDWDRHRRRQDTFGLLRRGVAGGSAEVETRKRQSNALGDLMADISARARQGQRDAQQADLNVRDRARGDVLQGLRWQGASSYRPYLSSLPDYEGEKRNYFGGLFSGLADGGLFD